MPARIPLNILDRSYLIPETATQDGLYFPMSLLLLIRLQQSPNSGALTAALKRLHESSPQLRLASVLNPVGMCWQTLPHETHEAHFSQMIQQLPYNDDIEALAGQLLCVNNNPVTHPLKLFISGDLLILKMHHSFGDGKFLFLLAQYLLTELQQKTEGRAVLASEGWMPVWRLVWRSPWQGIGVMWQFLRTAIGGYQSYQQDVQAARSASDRAPLRSGSAMKLRLQRIDAADMAHLDAARADISLNTLLQVILGECVQHIGMDTDPMIYTIPVDLRRYLPDPETTYPGNLAAQIRVQIPPQKTRLQRCHDLQTEVSHQLKQRLPLANIMGDWILALAGKKTYQAVNRNWLLKSAGNDPRTFVMTNLGTLESFFAPISDMLAPDFHPCLMVPLMGGPPLVISFNSFQNSGHLALTYDPQCLTESDIDSLLAQFTSIIRTLEPISNNGTT